MKKFKVAAVVVGILVFGGLCGMIHDKAGAQVAEEGHYVLGEEALSITGTSASLASIPAAAKAALICSYGDDIRFRMYTTAPTASVGAILNEGDCLYLDSRDQIKRFQAILATGGSAATVLAVYLGLP